MVNELYQLSTALQEAKIPVEIWHDEYLEIPKITKKDPCIRVVIDGDRVVKIESVDPEKKGNIKKFGNNQGSFPAMNLAPLFRISDESTKKAIVRMQTGKEEVDLEKIKSWCVENNWSGTFEKRYRVSFVNRTEELLQRLQGDTDSEPILSLIQAVFPFADPGKLHKALKAAAMQSLRRNRGDNTYLALYLLFDLSGQKESNGKNKKDKGTKNISIVLDTKDLERQGYSTIGPKFALGLNQALLLSERKAYIEKKKEGVDAFGQPFAQVGKTMPEVKLAAGFTVSLRTMFKEKPCQTRYGKIEDSSYPIAYEERLKLAGALRWIGDIDRKGKTWVRLREKEALLAFPSQLGEEIQSMTDLFARDAFGEALFEAKAKDFVEFLTRTKTSDPEHTPEWIEYFILRNVDDTSTRAKVSFSYCAKPEEIVMRSNNWQSAAKNLPTFHFGEPRTPFPMEIAGILETGQGKNGRIKSNDGSESLEAEKPKKQQKKKAPASDLGIISYSSSIPIYHGMQLFFRQSEIAKQDLRILIHDTTQMAVLAGSEICKGNRLEPGFLKNLSSVIVLSGMLLDWTGHRKEDYMNEYPYLFGQMLKAADCLHELYCVIVRNDGKADNFPPQFVGGSMYAAAAATPSRAFEQLQLRMLPYLNWAKTHRNEKYLISEQNDNIIYSRSAGYYLQAFTQIADKLKEAYTNQSRFSDEEKAQLFIGYLASFPQKGAKDLTSESQTEGTESKGDNSNE